MTTYLGSLKLDTPAKYRIWIAGDLNRSWSGQFGDLSISNEVMDDGTTLSVLTGPLVDQPALFGVLNKLYGLGFPLVSVDCVEVDPTKTA